MRPELELERDLLDAGAEFVTLKAKADAAYARVVRLARRLVVDGALTDEEAVRRAGFLALAALKAHVA